MMSVSMSSCRQTRVNTISLGEWILALSTKAGIYDYSQSAPYFMNITEISPYYSAVQACTEWKVLDPCAGFDPADPLTREWAAYTLVNLSGNEIQKSSLLKDSGRSRFPDHVEYAASSGLIKPVKGNLFCPKEIIDRNYALELLDHVVQYIDHRTFETTVQKIDWKDDFALVEKQPLEYFEDEMTAVLPADTEIREKDILSFNDESGEKQYWKENDICEEENEIKVKCEKPELQEYIESADIQNSFDIDFRKAEITDLADGFVLQQESSYADTGNVSFMSFRPLTRTHDVHGYKITYSVTSTGIYASASRKTPQGLETAGTFSLTGVHPSYNWQMENGRIEYGYFKVDFSTVETLSAGISSYKKYYGDPRGIDPDHFVESIRNAFKQQDTAAETIIPLARIKIPVPNAPLLDLVMQIQIRISANGRAQLTLTQNHCLGMEIRNGKMRVINEDQHNAQALLRSDLSLMNGVMTALKMASMTIADITVEGGAKANISSTVHVYDETGNHKSEKISDLPADYVNELSEDTDDVLVCGDIKAYWTADAVLNSAGSLASRLGFTRHISLLNETNGKLIPGMKTHIENWQFVDHCTRGDRQKQIRTGIIDSDTIQVKSYSLILSASESGSITVTGLPEGYTAADLVFVPEDTGIVKISDGRVLALNEGTTIVYVRTADGKYQVGVTVIVRENT